MKKVKNFLSDFLSGSLIITICAQLIFFSVPRAYAASCPSYNTTDDRELIQQQQQCDTTTGEYKNKYWDCARSRCMVDPEAQATQDAIAANFTDDAAECDAKPTDKERRECYAEKAEAQAGVTQDEGADAGLLDGNFGENILELFKMLSIAVATVNILSLKEPKLFPLTCISRGLFNVAALASLASELWFAYQLHSKIDSLKEAYVLSEDSFTAQLDAFKFLKSEQEMILEISEQKIYIHAALGLIYAASTVAAILEIAPYGPPKCSITFPASNYPKDNLDYLFEKTPVPTFESFNLAHLIDEETSAQDAMFLYRESKELNSLQSPSLSDYTFNHIDTFMTPSITTEFKQGLVMALKLSSQFVMNPAYATTDDESDLFDDSERWKKPTYFTLLTAGMAGGLALIALFTEGKFITNVLSNSIGIGIMAAVNATSMGILAGISHSDMESAQNNMDTLDEVIQNFEEATSGICLETDRSDLSKPSCYCYNDDGTRNTEQRGNSATCKSLWNPNWSNFDFIASDNSKNGTKKSASGCITINGEFDLKCKCRLFKDAATGRNACHQVNRQALNLGGIGGTLGLNSVASGLNQMSQGNYASGSMGSLNSLNSRAAKGKKMANQILAKYAKELKKAGMTANMFKRQNLEKMLQKVTSPQDIKRWGGGMSAQSQVQGAHAGKKGAAISAALKKTGLRKALYSKSKRKGKKKMRFNFDLENEGAKNVAKVSGDFGGKQYKIKHQDIVKNENVSIWKVISNRYNQTGLRVLFED